MVAASNVPSNKSTQAARAPDAEARDPWRGDRELGLPPAGGCSQECFKENWATHKKVHKKAKKKQVNFTTLVNALTPP
mgnify:CR=1 FL=1